MAALSLSKYQQAQDAPGWKRQKSGTINANFISSQFRDIFFVKLVNCC